jgi:hypothetical protein
MKLKDHQVAQMLAVVSAHIGLGVSAFLLFASISVLGMQAQTYAMQWGGIQMAAVANASTIIDPDSKRKQDLSTLAAALNAYYQKHTTYNVAGAGAGGSGTGVVSKDGLPTYKTIVQGLIADGDLSASTTLYAVSGDYYLLYTCSAGQSFALSARLDSPTSADITNIQTSCNGTGANGTYTVYGRNYAVTN